jgi:hypothetical protein
MTTPGDVVLKGERIEAPEGVTPKHTCTAAMPQAAVKVLLEMKAGPAEARVVDTPVAANGFSARVRFDQPGSYEFVLRWQP